MEVQLSADDIGGEGVGTGDVFLFSALGESVITRVPEDNNSVARTGVLFQQFNE